MNERVGAEWDLSLPRVVGLLAAGLPPALAWQRSGVAPPHEPFASDVERAIAAADGLAMRVGAPLGSMLLAIADVAADRREAAAIREAALAGPRLSAKVLAWLPLVGIGLGAVIEPATLKVLALSPVGWALLALGATLTWAGRAWTARIVTRASAAGVSPDDAPLAASALLAAALDGGADVAGALRAVGSALGEPEVVAWGEAVARGEWPPVAPRWEDMARAVRPAWEAGARAGPTLAATRRAATRRARAQAAIAAGEVGVKVVLPLTLCLLPAFVLVGLVPLLIAVVAGTGLM